MALVLVISIGMMILATLGLMWQMGLFNSNSSGDDSKTPTIPTTPPPTIPIPPPTPPPTIPIPPPPPPPVPKDVFCTQQFPTCSTDGSCLKPGCGADTSLLSSAQACNPPALTYMWAFAGDIITGNYINGIGDADSSRCTNDNDCPPDYPKCYISDGDCVLPCAADGDVSDCPPPYNSTWILKQDIPVSLEEANKAFSPGGKNCTKDYSSA